MGSNPTFSDLKKLFIINSALFQEVLARSKTLVRVGLKRRLRALGNSDYMLFLLKKFAANQTIRKNSQPQKILRPVQLISNEKTISVSIGNRNCTRYRSNMS